MKKNLGGIPAAWVFHVLIELLLIHFSVSIMPENNTSNKGTHPLLFKDSTPGIPFYFTRSNQLK